MLATPNFCAKAVDIISDDIVILKSTLGIAAIIGHVRAIAPFCFVKAFMVRTVTDINFKFINCIVFAAILIRPTFSEIHD